MSNQYRLPAQATSHSGETTAAYQGVIHQLDHPAKPCMALVAGSGPHYTDELSCLLRRRLRVAGLLGLAGFALFFIKILLVRNSYEMSGLDIGLHAAVVALLIAACAVLWSHVPLSWRALRAVELVMFGSMGLYFAYVQFAVFHNGLFLSWAQHEHQEKVLNLGTLANSLRWFMLMVLYGMFIPNTWRRCALVVGCMWAAPLILTFGLCINCPIMGPFTWRTMFDMTVILSLGAALAIFGSYKISCLQHEAFEAKKLGQYQLKEKLGAGGMGEVYLGEHLLLRRSCAIKLIRPDQAGDPANLARFEREVQAMATLTHWNTVEIYDYGRSGDGTFYYVMEYLPGMSLQELVDRHGPLPPGRAIHFLRQVCAALKEAHCIGLIHRDIKPSNVLACQRGGVHDVAKLLDFGLVQGTGLNLSSDRLTVQGSVLGSPPYISPEQALGKSQIDARTDIYSLGGLAYFLVTGRQPFVRETAMELLMAHVHDPVTPPRELRPEIPQDLEDVILRCLSKNANERFADVHDMDGALADCDHADGWDHRNAAQWWKESGRTRRTALV